MQRAASVENQTEWSLEKDWPGSYSPAVSGLVGEPDVVD